jgi:hypothetical protein
MAYTDSESSEITVPIMGVWIHDPDDPEGTLMNFPYGANQRSDSYDSMGAATYFVGKEDPVFDFGDPSSSSIDVTIDLPGGSDHLTNLLALRAFAASKKAVWYRDNRSRSMYGIISGLKVADSGFGSQVSFTFTKAHRAVEMIEAE